MTNAELIAKIKAEIERRKNYISVTHFAEELLSFLSTLESEKPMNLEKMEREEELKKAVHQVSEEIVKEIFSDDLENGDFFTEVDLKNCITRVAYQFADWQKEQMMKEAVGGEVRKDGTIGYFEFSNEQQFHSLLEQFKDCDKVRIIIVKED